MKTNNLKKQEEKTFFNGGDICDTCGQKMKDIGNGGYTHNCHTPKVATKQEEECEHKNISPNVIGLADEVCNDCGSKKYMSNRLPTPKVATVEEVINDWDKQAKELHEGKVATSEKECKHEIYEYPEQHCFFCKKCGVAHGTRELFLTPHESEDWVEFNLRARAGIQLQLEQAMKSGRTNKKLDFEEIRKRTDIAFESIKELAQSTSSKAYQRGREEVQTTVGEWIDKNSWKEGAGNEVIQVEDLKKFISGLMKK